MISPTLSAAVLCLAVGVRAAEAPSTDFRFKLTDGMVPATEFNPGEVIFTGRETASDGKIRFTKIKASRGLSPFTVLSEKVGWLDSAWPQKATKNRTNVTDAVIDDLRKKAAEDAFWAVVNRNLTAAVYPGHGKPMSADPVLNAAWEFAQDKSIKASLAYSDRAEKISSEFGVNPIPQHASRPAGSERSAAR